MPLGDGGAGASGYGLDIVRFGAGDETGDVYVDGLRVRGDGG